MIYKNQWKQSLCKKLKWWRRNGSVITTRSSERLNETNRDEYKAFCWTKEMPSCCADDRTNREEEEEWMMMFARLATGEWLLMLKVVLALAAQSEDDEMMGEMRN
jgi:hypothetical protein